MLFQFVGSYSKKDKKIFKSAQRQDLKIILAYLKTPLQDAKNIKFEVFDTREGKQNADPNHSISRASARFAEMTIYRYWEPKDDPHFPHEITHLVAHTWTKPYKWRVELDTWDDKKIVKTVEMVSTSFMQEGLAIAVDDIIFKRKLLEEREYKFIDDWCREQIDNMPTIKEVINLNGFGSFDNKLVVPFSASLSKYLLQKYGLSEYKKMYTSIKETNSAIKNVEILERLFGINKKELLADWRSSIS